MSYETEFEHTLQDGRRVLVACSEFEADDPDVGLVRGPTMVWVTLEGAGFPVSFDLLPFKDQDAILARAVEAYDDWCSEDDWV